MNDIVIFVEDPGAVNCIAPLAAQLRARGTPMRLYAAGAAVDLLRERGIDAAALAGTDAALSTSARLLIIGTSENPESPAFELIAAARSMGVRSVAIIDSIANSAHRFRGTATNPLAHAPDWLLVPDEATRQSFADLGFDPGAINIVGHPNDDHIRSVANELTRLGRAGARAATLRAGEDRFVIVFVSEISDGLDPGQYRRSADYTLTGNGGSDLRTEIVVEELFGAVAAIEAEGLPRPYLVLRRHPKESRFDLGDLVDGFDEVSAGGSPHALIFAADLVVGMSSMLLAEAELLDRPTLAVLPRAVERAWLSAVRDAAVPAVTSREELREALRRHLTGRPPATTSAPSSPAAVTAVDRIIAVLDTVAA